MAAFPVLQMRARQALRQSPIPALRKLSAEESDTTVVLLGSVPSYYLKQLAQESLRGAVGPRKLLNRVEVRR
jgi:hypothetical protein